MSGQQRHVSLVAVPESLVGPVTSIYEAFNLLGMLGAVEDSVPDESPFRVEIVGSTSSVTCEANGLSIPTHRSFDEVDHTDIIISPSMIFDGAQWEPGCSRPEVEWMRVMHEQGARLCGACTGAFLVADTGLLDGREATVHPAFAEAFRRHFPAVELHLESVLVTAGARGDLVTSGAASAWHDLFLYLVAQYAGPPAAQTIARFMLMQWHDHGQGPYLTFSPSTGHGDAAVRSAQEWVRDNYARADVLEGMRGVSGLTERSFKRRFRAATRYTPTGYIQSLRIEEAKRRLERTDAAIDEVGWKVGYDNTAFFRRLFKRLTGVTPGVYRRRFRVPDFRRGTGGSVHRVATH